MNPPPHSLWVGEEGGGGGGEIQKILIRKRLDNQETSGHIVDGEENEEEQANEFEEELQEVKEQAQQNPYKWGPDSPVDARIRQAIAATKNKWPAQGALMLRDPDVCKRHCSGKRANHCKDIRERDCAEAIQKLAAEVEAQNTLARIGPKVDKLFNALPKANVDRRVPPDMLQKILDSQQEILKKWTAMETRQAAIEAQLNKLSALGTQQA